MRFSGFLIGSNSGGSCCRRAVPPRKPLIPRSQTRGPDRRRTFLVSSLNYRARPSALLSPLSPRPTSKPLISSALCGACASHCDASTFMLSSRSPCKAVASRYDFIREVFFVSRGCGRCDSSDHACGSLILAPRSPPRHWGQDAYYCQEQQPTQGCLVCSCCPARVAHASSTH